MRIPIIYPLLILPVLISGCEKDVKDVRLPPFEQKLSVASFLTPADSISYFYVGSNRNIYGELGVKEDPGVLSGTISNGTFMAVLDTAVNGLQVSSAKMPIEPGATYTINITSDKGLNASATCTVPGKREFSVNADTFSVLIPNIPQGYNPRRIDVRLTIRDIPNEANYYRLKVGSIAYRYDFNTGKESSFDRELSVEKELFTDSGYDGKDIIKETRSGIGYFFNYDSAFIKVMLYNLERSYYLYQKSLDDYNGNENPFTEISPVYSNIKGGLGIFTSYTVDTIIFRIK